MSSNSLIVQSPEAVDTTNLHFKLLSKIKILDGGINWCEGASNLVAVSQFYGLTFIGTANGFLILKSSGLFSSANGNRYHKREVNLNSKVTHLAVDHEQKKLAVGCQTKGGPVLFVYDISTFLIQGGPPVKTVPLLQPDQNTNVWLCELMWQPNTDSALTACCSNGYVVSLNLFRGTKDEIFQIPPYTNARCFCWSPKGKQLVVGCDDGNLLQFKPDMKLVKKLGPPPVASGRVSVVNVHWISSFQFIAAYKDFSKTEEFPFIAVVNTPKNAPMTFINYDDITYSSLLFRTHQLYFYHLSAWNLIFVASANSIEIAVLSGDGDNSMWRQWLLGDASRAELPLNSEKVETFPFGMAVDYTSDQLIPWGEDSLPPMPRLLLLSSEGVLTTFNIINTVKDCPQLCAAPKENFDDSWFTVNEKIGESSEVVKNNQEDSKGFFITQPTALDSAKPDQKTGFPTMFASNLAVGSFGQTATSPTSAADNKIQTQYSNLGFFPMESFSAISRSAGQQQKSGVLGLHQSSAEHQTVTSDPGFLTSVANTTSKWSEKPEFLQPLTGIAGNSVASASKDSTSESVNQNRNMLNNQTVTPGEKTGLSDARVSEASKTPEKQAGGLSEIGVELKAAMPPELSTPQSNKPPTESLVPPTEENVSPERTVIDDSVYMSAISDEVKYFDSELKEVLSRVSSLKFSIGTDEEKMQVRNTIEKLDLLKKELSLTMESQKNEIQAIKIDVLEAFAWLEDAKSRNRQRRSRTFIELKKSEDLDPMSNRVMSEISSRKYYIENQLKQLHSYLMKEWMTHQDACRIDIRSMMAVPSMEQLYKTMVLELKILSKQRPVIEALKKRVMEKHKHKSRKSFSPNELNLSKSTESNRASELSKLADNLLQLKLDQDEEASENYVMDAFKVIMKNQVNSIVERSKKLNVQKQNILRDIFSEREMMKTHSAKSNLGTSSFIRNTASRMQALHQASLKKKEEEEEASKLVEKSNASTEAQDVAPTEGKITSPTAPAPPQKQEVTPSEKVEAKPASAPNTMFGHTASQDPPKSTFTFSPLKLSQTIDGGLKSNELVSQSRSNLSGGSGGSSQKTVTTPLTFNVTPVSASGANAALAPKSSGATIPWQWTPPTVSAAVQTTTTTTTSVTKADVFSFKKVDPVTKAATTTVTTTTRVFCFSSSPNTSAFSVKNTGFSTSGSIFGSRSQTSGTTSATSSNSQLFNTSKSSAASTFTFSLTPQEVTASSTSAPASGMTSSFPAFGSGKTDASSVFSFISPPLSFGSSFSSSKSDSSTPVSRISIFPTSAPDSSASVKATVAPESGTSVSIFKVSSKPNLIVTTKSSSPSTQVTVAIATTANAVTSASAPVPVTATATISKPSLIITPVTSVEKESKESAREATKSDSTKVDAKEGGKEVVVVEDEPAPQATTSGNVKSVVEESPAIAAASQANALVQPSTTGAIAATTTTSSSIFTLPPPAVSGSEKSSFGQAVSAAATTALSIFSTTSSSTSIFSPKPATTVSVCNASSATSTGNSIFGQAAVTTAVSGSIFGQVSPATTTATAFGQGGKEDVEQTMKLFDNVLSGDMSTGNVFKTANLMMNTPSTSSSGNIFFNMGFEKSGTTIFGNTPAATTTTASGTSIFGGSSGIFSQSSSSFGNTSSASSSFFGERKTTESGNSFFDRNMGSSFRTSTADTNQNPFATSSNFGFRQSLLEQSNSGQGIFGGMSSSNLFGGSSSSSSSGNIFQTGTSSLPPGPFGGGQSTVGQTNLSTSLSFQKPNIGGFGGAPVFGSGMTPTFGAQPTFGGAPTFGSPPSFSNTQKIFGSSSSMFGQNQDQSPNFGTLASQGADGFANLAQQSQSQAFGGNTFNPSATFGSDSNFGGQSFSNWRS